MSTSSHSQVSTGRRNIKEVDTVSGCEAKETRSLSNPMEGPGKTHTTTSVQRPVWISSRGEANIESVGDPTTTISDSIPSTTSDTDQGSPRIVHDPVLRIM